MFPSEELIEAIECLRFCYRLSELDQEIPLQTRQKVDSPTEEAEVKRTVIFLTSVH